MHFWFLFLNPIIMSYLIGVTGGTASGKTSTCLIIQKQLGQKVLIISMDNFYLDNKNNNNINFDHPNSFDWNLLRNTLKYIKAGKEVEIPEYCFVTHRRIGSIIIKPTECVIFEGILSLYDKEIRDLFDIKIFVDTPADIRLIRRIRRDIEERGRTLDSVLEQCENTVIPSHDQFIEPTKKHADLIIPRGRTNITAINVIITQIKQTKI